MDASDARAVWRRAGELDHTLRGAEKRWPALALRRVAPVAFGRGRMFMDMARARVGLYEGCPVRIRGSRHAADVRPLLAALRAYRGSDRARVRVGPAEVMRRLPFREVADRWCRARGRFCVTDLHIRETVAQRVIDTAAISDFNLLACSGARAREEEMLTLVISSRDAVTDSHTDDPDGTNHCFIGLKLWVAWDTFEGMEHGLQDVSRQDVHAQATFDLDTWLRLRSARWWIVRDGLTLFLPGNLAHKVMTLTPYIGVGSFNLTLANALRSLARWILRGPLWCLGRDGADQKDLVSVLAKAVGRKLEETHRSRTATAWGRQVWRAAERHWMRDTPGAERATALEATDMAPLRPWLAEGRSRPR